MAVNGFAHEFSEQRQRHASIALVPGPRRRRCSEKPRAALHGRRRAHRARPTPNLSASTRWIDGCRCVFILPSVQRGKHLYRTRTCGAAPRGARLDDIRSARRYPEERLYICDRRKAPTLFPFPGELPVGTGVGRPSL